MPIGIMELIVIGFIAFVIYISIKRSSKKKR
jgi:tetrahydromethanopterin S-methyltransferase subunit G